MRCHFCRDKIIHGRYDWGYLATDTGLVFAHMDCIAWEETRERLETEVYLSKAISF